jgi:hypothetical protein
MKIGKKLAAYELNKLLVIGGLLNLSLNSTRNEKVCFCKSRHRLDH